MFRMFRSRGPVLSRFTTYSLFTEVLLSFGLFDEVVSGLPFIGLPLLRSQFHLSYEQVGFLFTAGELSALLLEPIINLLSDRMSKRFWILGGTLGMVVSFLVAGLTSNYWLLLAAFILYYPADGAAVGLAEAALIDQRPEESTRTMTRWTLLSSIGDLLAPISVGLVASLHLGWSGLCWLASGIWLLMTLVIAPHAFAEARGTQDGKEEEEEEASGSLFSNVKEALHDPVLMRWIILSMLPTLVDEIFVGFVALYLHDALHIEESTVALLIAVHMIGAITGLFLLERFVLSWNIPPRRLLAVLALFSLAGMLALLLAHAVWLIGVTLFVVGLSVTGWYPVAQANAYAQRPGHAALVRSIGSLGAPFQIALPSIIGFIAQHFGLLAALSALSLAPVLLLLGVVGGKRSE